MTVETTANTVSYTGNNASTVFPFAFQIPTESDLYVYVNNVLQSPSTFTVTGIDLEAGGSVTYPVSGSPLTTSQTITITRTLPLTQTMDLTNQDGFYPETVEDGLDRLEMQIQQIHTSNVNNEQSIEDAINLFQSLIGSTSQVNLYNTRAAVALATIGAGVGFIITAGNASVGDGGNALLARDTVSTPGATQSVDGAWWKIASRPLKLMMFAGADKTGATSSTAAANLMKALAVEDEQIIVPAGSWLFSTAVTTLSKNVTWILDDGAQMSLTSNANLLTDYQTSNRTGGTQTYHSAKHGRSNTDTQETFEYHSFTVKSANGLVNHEKELRFDLIVTDDDELESGGSIYKAAVAHSPRAYIASTNPNGRAFALNPYVLIEAGGQGVLNAVEADASHNSHEQPDPFTADVKLGIASANVGPVACTAAFLVTGNTWWYGYISARASIKNDVSARAFCLQDVFGIDRDGYATFGKNSHDRDVVGVELGADGQIWGTSTATHNTILTRRGTPGTGVPAQILYQQKNSGGTIRSWINLFASISNAGAGTEASVWGIDGWLAGAATSLFLVSGSRLGPATDNIQTAGHPSARYTEVFSVNATINTSDAREKTNILSIDDKVLDAWGRLEAKQYQWIDSVGKKGENKARIHIGWVWQDVEAAFQAEGLDPRRYGLFCEDPIIEKVKVPGKVPKLTGTKEVPVLDENGKPIFNTMKEEIWEDGDRVYETAHKPKTRLVQRPRMKPEEVWEEVDGEVEVEKDTGRKRGGLRTEQCLILQSMWQKREVTRLSEAVRKLEAPSPAPLSASRTSPSPQPLAKSSEKEPGSEETRKDESQTPEA